MNPPDPIVNPVTGDSLKVLRTGRSSHESVRFEFTLPAGSGGSPLHFHTRICYGLFAVIHHGVSQVEAARAMNISKAQLSDVIRQRKGGSAAIALRFQFCFGVPGDLLIRLQGRFDFQKAYHAKNGILRKEVRAIA